MRKKLMSITALAVAGLLSAYALAYAAVTEQHAVVSGVVAADGLVQPGTMVQKGDGLVRVNSLAGGSVAAARASAAGKITDVLVQPGDKIIAKQAVAKLSE